MRPLGRSLEAEFFLFICGTKKTCEPRFCVLTPVTKYRSSVAEIDAFCPLYINSLGLWSVSVRLSLCKNSINIKTWMSLRKAWRWSACKPLFVFPIQPDSSSFSKVSSATLTTLISMPI